MTYNWESLRFSKYMNGGWETTYVLMIWEGKPVNRQIERERECVGAEWRMKIGGIYKEYHSFINILGKGEDI